MKRNQIIHYKVQLENFLQLLRLFIWGSLALSLLLFILALVFLYNEMLLSAMFTATAAFIFFRVLRHYSVIITKKWVGRRAGQEEMLLFLDEEMNGMTSRDFFHRLERALEMVNS